jgi:hypothetical protein
MHQSIQNITLWVNANPLFPPKTYPIPKCGTNRSNKSHHLNYSRHRSTRLSTRLSLKYKAIYIANRSHSKILGSNQARGETQEEENSWLTITKISSKRYWEGGNGVWLLIEWRLTLSQILRNAQKGSLNFNPKPNR